LTDAPAASTMMPQIGLSEVSVAPVLYGKKAKRGVENEDCLCPDGSTGIGRF
jgi:hypothetical protein